MLPPDKLKHISFSHPMMKDKNNTHVISTSGHGSVSQSVLSEIHQYLTDNIESKRARARWIRRVRPAHMSVTLLSSHSWSLSLTLVCNGNRVEAAVCVRCLLICNLTYMCFLYRQIDYISTNPHGYDSFFFAFHFKIDATTIVYNEYEYNRSSLCVCVHINSDSPDQTDLAGFK